MSYNVRYTDPKKGSIIVEDRTINQETDLSIPGRFSTAYGQSVGESMVHLLENFASPEEPMRPVEGQIWYDSSPGVNQLKVYDGTTWKESGGVKRGASQPSVSNSITGDLWVNTNTQQLFMFSGVNWVLIGPQASFGGQTTAEAAQIRGVDNVDHQVLKLRVGNKDLAIVSADSFIPTKTMSGFPRIDQGFNLNTGVFGNEVLKYRGRSESADALVVAGSTVSSSNFLRRDVVSSTNHKLRILADAGLDVGTNGQVELGVSNNVGIIRHKTSNSSFEFRFNNEQGQPETALTIESTGRVTIAGDNRTQGDAEITGDLSADSAEIAGQITAQQLGINGPSQLTGNVNVSGSLTVSDIVPSGTNSIGTSSDRFEKVHAEKIFADEFTGSLTGSATTASRLTTPREFKISGVVKTTDTVSFDGSSPVDLNVEFSEGIFEGIDAASEADDNYQLIVNTGAEVKTITVEDITSKIPAMHPGMIMPYASTIAPPGWLLCEGQEVEISQYQALYDAIGSVFGSASSGKFRLPDFRGKFPIGANPERSIGNSGGASSVTLEEENLPDHKHTLEGDTGNQYFAVREADGTPLDTSSTTLDIQADGTGTHGLAITGGVHDSFTGESFGIMNPYLAVNYIIFAGVS